MKIERIAKVILKIPSKLAGNLLFKLEQSPNAFKALVLLWIANIGIWSLVLEIVYGTEIKERVVGLILFVPSVTLCLAVLLDDRYEIKELK